MQKRKDKIVLIPLCFAALLASCASQEYVDERYIALEKKVTRLEKSCVSMSEVDVLMQAGFSGIEDATVLSFTKVQEEYQEVRELAGNAETSADEAFQIANLALEKADTQEAIFSSLEQEVDQVQEQVACMEQELQRSEKEQENMLELDSESKETDKSEALISKLTAPTPE